MATELRKKILTEAAIAMMPDHQNDDFKKLLEDKVTGSAIREQIIGDQIDQMSEVINKVRKYKINNWDAFNHLPDAKERKKRIKSSLEMKTFEMSLKASTNEIEVTRYGKILKVLQASSDESQNLQMASIVVESIILVLEVIGIPIHDTEDMIQKAVDIALPALQTSQALIDDIHTINEKYEEDDKIGIMKGVFQLVIDTVVEGVFWSIVKAFLFDKSWYDWVLTTAKIAASIATFATTGGLLQIAELLSVLIDGAFFMQKLANLTTFRKLSPQR